jgi:hypothetical protein
MWHVWGEMIKRQCSSRNPKESEPLERPRCKWTKNEGTMVSVESTVINFPAQQKQGIYGMVECVSHLLLKKRPVP